MVKFLMGRLQNKLIAAFLVALMIPTAVIALYTINTQTASLVEEALQNELNQVRNVGLLIERSFDRVKSDILFYAESASLTSYADAVTMNDPEAIQAALRRTATSFEAFARNMGIYDQMRLLDVNGNEIVRVNYAGGQAVIVPESELQNKAGRDYFEEPLKMQKGEVFVSALNLNVERGVIEVPHKPVIRFSTPLYAANGEIVGVVVTNMLGNVFLSLVRPDHAGEKAWLVDTTDGTYLAGPDESKLFGRDLKTDISFLNDYPNDARLMLQDEDGALLGTQDQPEQIISFSRVALPELGGIEWIIYSTRLISDALAQVDDARNVILVISGLALLGAVTLALFVTQTISRPLRQLAKAAVRLGEGDLETPVPIVEGSDEIARLAQAFATMSRDLRHIYSEMETAIAARTRDLATAVQVNAQISTILETERLLQDVVDLTKERFRLYHAHIYLLDESGQNLRLASGAGHVGRQMVAQGKEIAFNHPQSIVAAAARGRKGVIINDVTGSTTFLPNPLLPDTRSELAVPLVARGQLLGVLDVQSDVKGYFDQNALSILELLSGQIGIAISNAQLYEVAERTSRHEKALGTIDRRIQNATDIDEILQATVRELGKALRVPYTAIALKLDNDDSALEPSAMQSEA